MRFRVAGPMGGAATVTARELPVANRLNHLLRCPVAEFPDECPWDMTPDIWASLLTARQQIHLREIRKSFVSVEDLTTGVPLGLQGGPSPLTPSFAQPVPTTPPLQRPFWTEAEAVMAKQVTPEQWEATASSVRDGSSGGLPPADATSEDLFLAPQAVVAEVVPLISPRPIIAHGETLCIR